MFNHVKINGKAYPIEVTMGGLMLYARKKGILVKDIFSISVTDLNVEEYALLLFCLVSVACKLQGVQFPFTEQDIEDALYTDDELVMALVKLFNVDEQASVDEKK